MAFSRIVLPICAATLIGGPVLAGSVADAFVASADPAAMYNVLGIDIQVLAPVNNPDIDVFVFSASTPAGQGVPPHVHAIEDETVYVVDGNYDVMLGAQMTQVGAGAVLYLPKGVPHAFTNTGSAASTTIWVIDPGKGFGEFFGELSKLPPGPPDIAKLTEAFAAHDIQLLPPPQ